MLSLLKDTASSDYLDCSGPAHVSSRLPLNPLICSSGRKERSIRDRAMWYHPLPCEDLRERQQEAERSGESSSFHGGGGGAWHSLRVGVDKHRRSQAFAEEGTGPSFSFNLFYVILCI